MTDESKKTVSVDVPVVDGRFSLYFPKACSYCAKPLSEGSDEFRLLHIKGESQSSRQIAPGAPYIRTTRTVEFDIPYCAKHFDENQRNLELTNRVNWITRIILFILLFPLLGIVCSSASGETDALVVMTLIGSVFLTAVITDSITTRITRILIKRNPSLKSFDDMLEVKDKALTKKILGISVAPYERAIRVELANHEYANLMVNQNANAKIVDS